MTEALRPMGPSSALDYFQHLHDGSWSGPALLLDDNVRFQQGSAESIKVMQLGRVSTRDPTVGMLAQARSYWQGAIWIEGSLRHRSTLIPVRCPLFTRSVGLAFDQNALLKSVTPTSPWTLTPGLFPEDAADVFLFHTRPNDGGMGLNGPSEGLQQAANALITEAFTDGIRPTIRWQQFGLFRATEQIKVGLEAWQSDEVFETAFFSLYSATDGEVAAPSAAEALRCPLPLNEQQAAIIHKATNNPTVVVSGPPGTGKTHLVAAAALEQLGRGKSTLIAVSSQAAADSIEEMLSRFPMVEAVRFGHGISPYMLGNQLAEGTPDGGTQFTPAWTQSQVASINENLSLVSAQLDERLRATAVSEAAASLRAKLPTWVQTVPELKEIVELKNLLVNTDASGVAGAWKKRRALHALRLRLNAPRQTAVGHLRSAVQQLEEIALAETPSGDTPTVELWEQLETLTADRHKAAANHLESLRRANSTPASRRTLGQLASALREPLDAQRQLSLAEKPKAFVESAPLWFGTLHDLDQILPAVPGLFDLVIFDEASQVSQLEGVHGLMRAKRSLIIGDPRQIRHVPISTAEERAEAIVHAKLDGDAAAQLDEANVSLFDAAAQQAPVLRLDEHFRCSPHIIGFCNDRFYNERLRLMTQHPSREARDSIHHVVTSGPEARAVVVEIAKLSGFAARSVGVVGGHAAHVEELRTLIETEIPRREREKLALRIGTPAEFQGIERQIIIVSPGIDLTNQHLLAELENPNVFNVVASRAQTDVYVVTSLAAKDLPDGLLKDYLQWSHEPPEPFLTSTEATGWQGQLARDLAALGDMRIVVDYPVGGHTVDLAVGVGAMAFGVETSVHPDGVEAHISRHLALRRAGWRMVDAFESDWRGRREECVAWLAALWART